MSFVSDQTCFSSSSYAWFHEHFFESSHVLLSEDMSFCGELYWWAALVGAQERQLTKTGIAISLTLDTHNRILLETVATEVSHALRH
jgi:hypothetical protein